MNPNQQLNSWIVVWSMKLTGQKLDNSPTPTPTPTPISVEVAAEAEAMQKFGIKSNQ